ncbi:hypothetical protein ACWCP6_29840 [Streptomyces sp. NPDC002004]
MSVDLERVTDELYGLPPEEFVDARTRHAAAARAAGEKALAARIGALRRPTLSAWASNLLVRAHPDEAAGLLRLGEALRQAHLHLDREQLRELSSRQHTVVGSLARMAGQLTAESGHPIGDGARRELETTLHAVLADPDLAREWAAGRITRPFGPPTGFPAVAASSSRPAATPPPQPERTTQEGGKAVASAARSKADERRASERRRKAAEARRGAEAAERQAHLLEEELERAQAEAGRAESELEEAERRTADLAEELKTAEEQQREARRRLAGTRSRVTEVGDTARTARRAAQTARSHADGLEG